MEVKKHHPLFKKKNIKKYKFLKTQDRKDWYKRKSDKKIILWNGKRWHCEHGRQKNLCKECGGASICEHGTRKRICKDCDGASICEHGRQKSNCKECAGASICEHNRRKIQCKECGGISICEHGRQKGNCKECGGASICNHNKLRNSCKECGGTSICEHGRQKSKCKECDGVSICEHGKRRCICKECDIVGYVKSLQSTRIYSALNGNKSKRTVEYLGCTIEHFKKHIESKWEPGMSWDNHGNGTGTWQIDHIVPVKYGENVTLEQCIERLHWENTQPLWTKNNISKGNRYIG